MRKNKKDHRRKVQKRKLAQANEVNRMKNQVKKINQLSMYNNEVVDEYVTVHPAGENEDQ